MSVKPPTLSEIKDRTLKMEVDHAKAVGLPLSVAEAENVRMLERSERIARDSKPAPKKTKPAAITPNMGRDQRVAERGVTVKAAKADKPLAKLSPCGRCGLCKNCLRERRVFKIVQMRKTDEFLKVLADRLFISAFQASAGAGRFRGLSKRDIDRALTREVESACDASVRLLGEWRK